MALLKPDLVVGRLADLDIGFWYEKGIRAVLIDLDNTISPWRENRITKDARDFFARAGTNGIRVLLFTNASGSRARKAAQCAGLEAVFQAKKPFPAGYKRVLKKLRLEPSQVMTIGDQIFTDTLGGNLAGCTTVLIPPLEDHEYGGTKVLRFMEKLIGVKQIFRRPVGGPDED